MVKTIKKIINNMPNAVMTYYDDNQFMIKYDNTLNKEYLDKEMYSQEEVDLIEKNRYDEIEAGIRALN